MRILVVNCGSSSVKADIIEFPSQNSLHQLRVERIGKNASGTLNDNSLTFPISDDYETALKETLLHFLEEWKGSPISGVGHRVVHGGAEFAQPVLIDEHVKKAIAKMIPLVPLHP